MNSSSPYTTRASLAAAIEQLRLVVQSRVCEQAVNNVPPPARPVHVERDDDEAEMGQNAERWAPGIVDGRLHQLTNARWLRPWCRRGEVEIRPPLIEEVDQTGVDRRCIARFVSPQTLARIEQEVRDERARLCAEQAANPQVTVWSFQHLLLLRLQELVLVHEHTVKAPSQTFPIQWGIGDAVLYSGERYTVTRITNTKISLSSDDAGELDVFISSPELSRLRRIPAPTDGTLTRAH